MRWELLFNPRLLCERLAVESIRKRRLAELKHARRSALPPPAAAITEVSFITYYEEQCLFHDVVHHLAQAGLFLTARSFTTPAGRPIGQTDVLFMPAEARR